MHIASYQAFIWLQVDQRYQDVSSSVGHGWKLAEDITIDYIWTGSYMFTTRTVNVMCAGTSGFELETQDDDAVGLCKEVENIIEIV